MDLTQGRKKLPCTLFINSYAKYCGLYIYFFECKLLQPRWGLFGKGNSYSLEPRHAHDWRIRSGRVLFALDAFWMGEILCVHVADMLKSSISVAIQLTYCATSELCISCVFLWLLFELFTCRITVQSKIEY